MAFAYHQEALRKRRILERKHIAQKLIADEVAAVQGDVGSPSSMLIVDDKVLFTDRVENIQNRPEGASRPLPAENAILKDVIHDTNFKYRVLKDCGANPAHIDSIYRIMYPGCRMVTAAPGQPGSAQS